MSHKNVYNILILVKYNILNINNEIDRCFAWIENYLEFNMNMPCVDK